METKATSKGQIVIPVDLRRRFGIKAGTRVSIRVDEKENTIVLKPITAEFIKSLRGIDRGKGMLEALIEDRRLENEREEKAIGRFLKKSVTIQRAHRGSSTPRHKGTKKAGIK